MVLDIFLFMWLATRYEYVTDEDSSFALANETELSTDSKTPSIDGLDNPSYEKTN